MPVGESCEIVLGARREDGGGKRIHLFMNSVMQAWRDGWRNKRVVRSRSVTGSLAKIMKGRNVSMEVKRGLKNSISLPALIINIWFRGIGMVWGTAIEGACCGNELPERSLWSDLMRGESNESV